jgi:hypothetical protein
VTSDIGARFDEKKFFSRIEFERDCVLWAKPALSSVPIQKSLKTTSKVTHSNIKSHSQALINEKSYLTRHDRSPFSKINAIGCEISKKLEQRNSAAQAIYRDSK